MQCDRYITGKGIIFHEVFIELYIHKMMGLLFFNVSSMISKERCMIYKERNSIVIFKGRMWDPPKSDYLGLFVVFAIEWPK